jgi:hypothetical protein
MCTCIEGVLAKLLQELHEVTFTNWSLPFRSAIDNIHALVELSTGDVVVHTLSRLSGLQAWLSLKARCTSWPLGALGPEISMPEPEPLATTS